MADSNDGVLLRKISGARSRYRLLLAATGVLAAVAVTLAVCLACFHIDRHSPLSTQSRYIWRNSIVGIFGVGIIASGLLALLLNLPDRVLAEHVERRYPQLKESLLTSLDLGTNGEQALACGFSTALVRKIYTETSSTAAVLDFNAAVSTQGIKRAAVFLAVVGALFIVDAGLAGPAFAVWAQRILHPGDDIAPFAATRLMVIPQRQLIATGSPLRVEVETWGVPADHGSLMVRTNGGVTRAWSAVPLLQPTAPSSSTARKGERLFNVVLPALTSSVDLYAVANDGRSNVQHVEVVNRPAITNVHVTVRYPAYIHRPDETMSIPTGSFAAPAGSVISLEAIASSPLKHAAVMVNGRYAEGWHVNGDTVSTTQTLTHTFSYKIALTASNGISSKQVPTGTVQAQRDQPPTVVIDSPARDLELTPQGSFPLQATASDDYGVAQLDLVYNRTRTDPSKVGTSALVHEASGNLPMPGANDTPQVQTAVRWHIASVSPRVGDTIHYRVDAVDNDTFDGPHVAHSISYNVLVVSVPAMQLQLQARLLAEQQALQLLVKHQAEAKQLLQHAEKTGHTADLAKAIQAQQSAASEAGDLAQQVQSNSRDLHNNNLATKEDLEQRARALGLLNKDAQRSMPDAASSEQSATAQHGTQAAQNTEHASAQQRKIEQDLAEAQSLLRQPPTAGQLAQRASELAQDEQQQAEGSQAMQQDLHRQDVQDALRQQQATRAKTKQLQNDLQRAAQDAAQRGDNDTAKAEQQAAQALKQGFATKNQRQAEQNLSKMQPGKAAVPQQNAANALQKAAQAMANASGASKNLSPQDKLNAAAQALKALAQQQQAIAKQLKSQQDKAAQQKLGAKESAINKQAGKQQQNLSGSTQAQQSLQGAQQNLGKSGQSLQQGQQKKAQSPADKAAQQLQHAADQAKRAAQQMQQDAAARALANKVARLAQEEHGLHDATSRLEEKHKAGTLDFNDLRERRQIGARQQLLQQDVGGLADKFPMKAFQQALRMAERQMDPATKNLNRDDPDTGSVTQNSEDRAASTLDSVSRALQSQAQNSGSPPSSSSSSSQSSSSPQQQQQAEALGELLLAQGLQQQLRQDTGKVAPYSKTTPTPALTPEQRAEAQRLAKRQKETGDITGSAEQDLQQAPDAAKSAAGARRQMNMAQGRLKNSDPGTITRHHQDAAITRLNQAIQQTQQSLQQMQQQQQAMQQAANGAPQPASKPGSQPMTGAFTRIEKAQGGRTSMPNGAKVAGSPFSQRTTRALNQGRHDRVPPEYQSLVHQYYTRLSKKGH